jgi:predicted O-methyltransferase YrrM
MAPQEWAQVQSAIYSTGATTVVEWGSGGSTLALHAMVQNVVSVEHDPAWAQKVREELPADKRDSLHFVPASDPEPGVDWEWRKRAELERDLLAAYIDRPRSLGVKPDVVLVDGRARRFCIIEGLQLLRPGGLVILHDAQRRIYHDVIPKHAVFLGGWRQGQVCLVRKN